MVLRLSNGWNMWCFSASARILLVALICVLAFHADVATHRGQQFACIAWLSVASYRCFCDCVSLPRGCNLHVFLRVVGALVDSLRRPPNVRSSQWVEWVGRRGAQAGLQACSTLHGALAGGSKFQGPLWNFAVYTRSTHGQHTVNIRSTHGQHTVNIRSTYGQHTVNTRSTCTGIVRKRIWQLHFLLSGVGLQSLIK